MKATVMHVSVLMAFGLASFPDALAGLPTEQADTLLGAISPQQFGAKADGHGNDTAAVQTAIDVASAKHGCVLLSGKYRVDHVRIENANGLHVVAHGALLIGSREGRFPAVLEIKNSSDVSVTGKLEVSAQYNADYEAAVWAYTDRPVGAGASKLQFFDVSVANARLAWRFGAPSAPRGLVSEIAVHGGHTYGCSGVIEVLGYESVVNFLGYNIISDEGAKKQWKTLSENTVRVVAGHLLITGGEVQHNSDTKGTLISIEPGPAEHGLMSYGSVYISNAAVETAAPLVAITNASECDAPDTGVVSLHQCFGYHSQDLGPFVTTDSKYSGWLVMKDNNFYAGAKRSQLNIAASNATKIDVDMKSFGRNFKQGRAGISGGCFPESHP